MQRRIYRGALQAVASFKGSVGVLGTEHAARDGMFDLLKQAEKEVPLARFRGTAPDGARRARIDIVYDYHGIELKVARMPRSRSQSSMGCLYDLGQITNDYLKIESAKDLHSGELVIVVYGPLVIDLGPGPIYREFHNRMYVDYTTSCHLGELHPDHVAGEPEWKRLMRRMQHRVIKRMGFHRPCDDAKRCTVINEGDLALISIPVAIAGKR